MKHNIYCTSLLSLMMLVSLSGCGKGKSAAPASAAEAAGDTLPAPVEQLVAIVGENDSVAFAEMVSYPLERKYPLPDIEDEKEMRGYYSRLVDAPLRDKITGSKPQDWEQMGWRGYTLSNGEWIWIDEEVYDVPYMSKYEQKEWNRLVKADIATLPQAMQPGWIPSGCYEGDDTGIVCRLDKSETAKDSPYRLSLYLANDDLRGTPHNVFYGKEQTEGSAEEVCYVFDGGKEGTYILTPYSPDEGGEPVLEITKGGTTRLIELEKANWLQLLSGYKR